MSAGGFAALEAITARHDIGAAVLDSPAFFDLSTEASNINTALLLLAGTADEYVHFTDQQAMVQALQRAGKDVDGHYYQGGRHALILDRVNKGEAIQRIIDLSSVD